MICGTPLREMVVNIGRVIKLGLSVFHLIKQRLHNSRSCLGGLTTCVSEASLVAIGSRHLRPRDPAPAKRHDRTSPDRRRRRRKMEERGGKENEKNEVYDVEFTK